MVNIMHEHLNGGPYDIRPNNAFEPLMNFYLNSESWKLEFFR